MPSACRRRVDLLGVARRGPSWSTARSPSSSTRPSCRSRRTRPRSLRSCLRRIGRTRIPCSDSTFSASSKITGRTFVAVGDLEVPHQQVHRLGHPRAAPSAAGSRAGARAGRSSAAARSPRSARRSRRSSRSRRADHPLHARARAATPRRRRAARRRPPGRPRTRGSRTSPSCFCWYSLNAWLICALIRPTTRPSRQARKYSASPCVKNAFRRRSGTATARASAAAPTAGG